MMAALSIFVVYDSPVDLPGRFVAREFLNDRLTANLLQDKTLDGLREKLPKGLFRIDRNPNDEPKIVECWL